MLLEKDRRYTFSQIFELSAETWELLADYGYDFQIATLNLPHTSIDYPAKLSEMQRRLQEHRPYISLTTEMARREFYISPLIFAVLDAIRFRISIEYHVETERLRGDIDYVLRGASNVIVVEAKRADMERGFTQLAFEMIALAAHGRDIERDAIYGVVTTGDLWQFGRLDIATKTITKDINQFLLPQDIHRLFEILVALLGDRPMTSSV